METPAPSTQNTPKARRGSCLLRIGKWVLALIGLLLLLLAVRKGWQSIDWRRFSINNEAYEETFDEVGTWKTDDHPHASGRIADGRYEIEVNADIDIFSTNNDQIFADGVYQVEATQLGGPEDNGYGMMVRMDEEDNTFYMLAISGDGYAWTGRCDGSCEHNNWVEAPAVKRGIGETNVLRIVADGDTLTYFVNDEEIVSPEDNTQDNGTRQYGTVGLMAETLGFPGTHVAFDNFTVTPLSD